MLDSKRLGNQRVEARMILRWLRHPSKYPRQQNAGYTIMWKGYEDALCLYYNACLKEWAKRGGVNNICQPEPIPTKRHIVMPPWLGDGAFHETHQSALLSKLPLHYEQFGWKINRPPKVEYLWPRPIPGEPRAYILCLAGSTTTATATATSTSLSRPNNGITANVIQPKTSKLPKAKVVVAKQQQLRVKTKRRENHPSNHGQPQRRFQPSRQLRRSPRLLGQCPGKTIYK